MPAFKKRSRHDNIFSCATDRIVCDTKNHTADNHVRDTKDCTADNHVCETKDCTADNPETVAKIHFKKCHRMFRKIKKDSIFR